MRREAVAPFLRRLVGDFGLALERASDPPLPQEGSRWSFFPSCRLWAEHWSSYPLGMSCIVSLAWLFRGSIIPSTPARGEHATRSAFISDPEKTDETIEIDESGFSNFLCSRYEAMTDRRASSVCADMYPLMFLAAPNQNTRPINLVEYASERHPRGTCLEESRRDGM